MSTGDDLSYTVPIQNPTKFELFVIIINKHKIVSSSFAAGESRCMAMRFDTWTLRGPREEDFQEGTSLILFYYFLLSRGGWGVVGVTRI